MPTTPAMRATFYPRLGKRLFDVTVSAVALLGVAPLLGALAVVGVATQGRPVLFSQRRIGRGGVPFTIWKLRTMATRENPDSTVTARGDARVTTWGSWLRRFKLDELPQLWCVVRGDMSLVGPRPDVPGYWDEVDGADRALLALRPGLTGPTILIFRPEEALLAAVTDPIEFNDHVLFPEKVRLTWKYAAEQTLLNDLRWIVYTLLPRRVLRRRLAARGWTSPILSTHRMGDLQR